MGSKSWFVTRVFGALWASAAVLALAALPAGALEPGQEVPRPVSPVPEALAGRQPEVLQWLDGGIAYNWHNECITGAVEALTGHYVGYYGETTATFPRVNDVYYGHIVISTLGNPCAGPYIHVEIAPPPASDVVSSPSYPIYCFYTNPQGQTSQVTDGSCPTAASLTIGPFGGYNFDSRPAPGWGGGPWPLAQGAFLEIQFPLISFQPMSGIATNSYLYGLAQALAGVSPYSVATQGVFVAPAPGGTTCPARVKGDLSQDGRPDLIWRNTFTNRHMIWTMNGSSLASAQWVSPDPPAGFQVVASDDFNADNRSDLVLANPTTGAVQFWLMNHNVRVGSAVSLTGALAPPWKIASSGDFNGDGKPDLVWRNSSTQKLLIWTMNGTTKLGQIVPSPDQAADPNWEVVATLDYNGDGLRDFLWYNWSSGKIVTWTMNASVQRTAGQFTNPANAGDANWKVLAGGDYTAAGGPGAASCTNDVVWRNATSGRAVVWQMDNASTRLAGGFTTPDGPTADPDGNATNRTDWILAGPR